ncbi:MAG TPA: hypothetical protein PKD55_00415 [Bellilinea sp.]|nr:hypothetical protein [Bellilinea sp.]
MSDSGDIDLRDAVMQALLDDESGAFGFEVVQPAIAPAITEKYVYVSLEKYWTGVNLHSGPNSRDEIRAGFNLVPPVGKELLVALPRPGKEGVEEEVLEGAMTLAEFLDHQETLVQASLAVEHVARIPTPKGTGF